MNRRTFLPVLSGAAALLTAQESAKEPVKRKGRLKQGVTKGVFRGTKMTFDDMCRESAQLGIYGFDLINPADWPTVKKYGLTPTMTPPPYAGTIPDGIIEKNNHKQLAKTTHEIIDTAAGAGCPNVIVMAGSRRGMADDVGADHSVEFLNSVKAHAEEKGVTLCLELLNSKVDHKDYMCDHAAWGVGVMKRVNSPRVKLLYDIYHMQIMDGDIVRTITEDLAYLGHFHTGGNPGRHEIDESQELNYRLVAKTLADLGYNGVISHEYTPVRDPLASLAQAIDIFTV